MPRVLVETFAAHVAQRRRAEHVLTTQGGEQCGPWTLDRAVRGVRGTIGGLPAGFRFHDLRRPFASPLIASGANVKMMQARLRHTSATTTLDTYRHLWPNADDATRAAVETVLVARPDYMRTEGVIG